MDTFRLKNIIILILVLMNVFLLGSLELRHASRQNAYHRATRQLVALFEKDGIALDASTIPDTTPPAGRTLARSTDLDAEIASYLLGADVTAVDKGGGIFSYQSGNSTAQFRANGSFDITCSVTPDDPETYCRKFFQKFGYGDVVSTLESGSGAVTAIQYYDRLPVINCTVTFQFNGGVLQTVSGTHIPDTYTSLSSEEPISALTALSTFLEARRSSGAVMSSVNDMYLCYELQSSTASPISLTPAWCIVTDTINYYVNCLTGFVTHS